MAAIVNARDALMQIPGTVRVIATDLEDPLSMFSSVKTWDFRNTLDGWTIGNAGNTPREDSLEIVAATSDPQMTSPVLSLYGGFYDKVRARVRRKAGNGWQGTLYYTTTDRSTYQELFSKSIPDSTVGGNWVFLEWDMATLVDWKGKTIKSIRLDLGGAINDAFEIDWVSVGRYGPPASAEDMAKAQADIVTAGTTATWGGLANIPYDTILNTDDSVALGFNPSFSDWPEGSVRPTGWSGQTPSRETLIKRLGQWSVGFTTNGTSQYAINKRVAVPALPLGTFVAGTFDIYISAINPANTTGKPGMMVRLWYNNTTQYVDRPFPAQLTAGVWQRINFTARGQAGQQITAIEFYLFGAFSSVPMFGGYFNGTVMYDSFRFGLFDSSMDNTTISLAADGTLTGGAGGTQKVTITGLGYTGELDATKGAPSGTLVAGVSADSVATAMTNFNASNDRKSTAVVSPTVLSDGTAVDHTINTDGSSNISFEWQWSGTEGDIDGFLVYVYQTTSTGAYTFGTSPAEETVFTLPANQRSFILYGAATNQYVTFGIQAYRSVDKDIAASGAIKSAIVKSSLLAENPYRPAATVAFSGDVTGTVGGTAASTVVSNASAGKTANDALPAMNTAITGKLAKNANDTITGQISLQSQYALLVGTANDGIFYGSTGMYGRKGGVTQLSIGADGTAYFGGTLGANIVEAGNIKAGAVRVSHLTVQGDVSNLIRDPRFEDPNWWGLTGQNYGRGDWSTTQTTSWKDNCSLYLYNTGNVYKEIWTKEMMIEPGAVYYFEYQISFSGDFYGDVSVEWYMPAVSWYGFGVPASGYTFSDGGPIHYPSNSRGFKQVTGAVTIPNDPRLVKSAIRIRFKTSAGSFELGGFRIIRAQDSVLIRDGAISANKMLLPWGGYINSGQWDFDAGDGFWLQGGDDPRFSIGAGNARLTFRKSTGMLKMRGAIEGSSIRTSVLGIESARMITDWNFTAPFVVFDTAGSYSSASRSRTVTLSDFCGPAYSGAQYHSKRFAAFKKDVFIKVTVNGDFGWENLFIDVEYHKNGSWTNITSTSADCNYRAGFTVVTRYTPWNGGWDWIAFRARTTQGNTYSITMEIQVFNFNDSPYGDNTNSGINGSDATYTPPPPRETDPWCVDYETARFPNGMYARDTLVGDLVEVWNDDPINPGTEFAPARQVRFGQEESYRITSASGAELLQSKSTPMTLRDGRMIYTPALLGEEILVKRGNDLAWERVVSLENIGERKVVKLSFGDRTFFAGTDPEATIATHNIQQLKP